MDKAPLAFIPVFPAAAGSCFQWKKFINKNALQYQMDVTHYGQPWAAKDGDFILGSVQNNSDLTLSEERVFWTCVHIWRALCLLAREDPR